MFTPQLKDLLLRTINAYLSLFEHDNRLKLPLLKMELTFDDQEMQFYPPVQDLEEAVLFVVTQITKTMQQVSISFCVHTSMRMCACMCLCTSLKNTSIYTSN